MSLSMTKKLSLVSFAFVALLSFGCDEVEQSFDCSQICSRYADCFDEDYDVSDCNERCRDNADDDQDFADQAGQCETCLDDRSCSGAFACTGECIGVVP